MLFYKIVFKRVTYDNVVVDIILQWKILKYSKIKKITLL